MAAFIWHLNILWCYLIEFQLHLWKGDEHYSWHLHKRKQSILVTFPRSHSSVEDHKLLKDRYYLTVVVTIIILVSGGAELKVWMNEGVELG